MKHYQGKDNTCIYCDKKFKNVEDIHFMSDCCGRGMCDDCYHNGVEHDEQLHAFSWDWENADEESDKVRLMMMKCGWEDAHYLCFECMSNWAWYVIK